MSPTFRKCQYFARTYKGHFRGIKDTFLAIRNMIGESDDYRNVPYHSENI